MAKINFHRVKGTPWGSFVSSVIRTWAGGKDAQQVESLKFDELDIQISLNGVPLSDEEHERLSQVINKSSDMTTLSSVRTRINNAFEDLESSVNDVDPHAIAQAVMERVQDRLSSVDLSGYLEEIDISYLADEVDVSSLGEGYSSDAISAVSDFKHILEKI